MTVVSLTLSFTLSVQLKENKLMGFIIINNEHIKKYEKKF